METMKRFVYFFMFVVLFFAHERTLGGNNKDCIRLVFDSIVVTSQYVKNESDNRLGYYDLKVEKSDSTKVLTGVYIKRKTGLWLGLSTPYSIGDTNIQGYFSGISSVLSYLSKYESIKELEGMQVDIPSDIAVEVTKIYYSNRRWKKKEEMIKKSIMNSYYVTKINECLKIYSLHINDLSIGHIVINDTSNRNVLLNSFQRKIAEIELFLDIRGYDANPVDHGVGSSDCKQ